MNNLHLLPFQQEEETAGRARRGRQATPQNAGAARGSQGGRGK